MKDGVQVELFITKDKINANSGIDFDRLRSLGATVEMVGGGGKKQQLMHNRFCVVDAETVIISSYNWTFVELKSDENITVVSDASTEIGDNSIISSPGMATHARWI